MPEYRHNHYVPAWYQSRFIPAGTADRELFYLDLHPTDGYRDKRGTFHPGSGRHRWGPRKCFAEDDLYTSYLGATPATEIERFFFGEIDRKGRAAVEAFGAFSHESRGAFEAFHDLLLYMVTQKLRTPKGLGWLAGQVGIDNREQLLRLMMNLRRMYNAVWSECVWLIADAIHSDTKFIISDHPVALYNRECGPRSRWCRGYEDPDPRFHATHVLFPLSIDRILILTNLSWVRNPYQSGLAPRPNPSLARAGLFKFMDIQAERHLTEQEVREINFILKSRALRYVAAGVEDWLYPERYVSKSDWSTFGHGYLLMPDPRSIHMGGTAYLGYDSGRTDAFDEYGRKPWESDFGAGAGSEESAALDRFKGEFSRLFGRRRRGRTWEFGSLQAEDVGQEEHRFNLSLEEEGKNALRRLRSRAQ